jgi:hypothetical protein
MKKILLVAMLVAFASAATLPTLGNVLGFGTAAYAHGNDQGDDDNNQGNEQ